MSKGKEPLDPVLEEKRRKRRENAAKKPKKKKKVTVRSSEPRQWNPEPYITALEARSFLMLIIKNGNTAERRQATSELAICDAKLKRMQDMPGFDLSIAGPLSSSLIVAPWQCKTALPKHCQRLSGCQH